MIFFIDFFYLKRKAKSVTFPQSSRFKEDKQSNIPGPGYYEHPTSKSPYELKQYIYKTIIFLYIIIFLKINKIL